MKMQEDYKEMEQIYELSKTYANYIWTPETGKQIENFIFKNSNDHSNLNPIQLSVLRNFNNVTRTTFSNSPNYISQYKPVSVKLSPEIDSENIRQTFNRFNQDIGNQLNTYFMRFNTYYTKVNEYLEEKKSREQRAYTDAYGTGFKNFEVVSKRISPPPEKETSTGNNRVKLEVDTAAEEFCKDYEDAIDSNTLAILPLMKHKFLPNNNDSSERTFLMQLLLHNESLNDSRKIKQNDGSLRAVVLYLLREIFKTVVMYIYCPLKRETQDSGRRVQTGGAGQGKGKGQGQGKRPARGKKDLKTDPKTDPKNGTDSEDLPGMVDKLMQKSGLLIKLIKQFDSHDKMILYILYYAYHVMHYEDDDTIFPKFDDNEIKIDRIDTLDRNDDNNYATEILKDISKIATAEVDKMRNTLKGIDIKRNRKRKETSDKKFFLGEMSVIDPDPKKTIVFEDRNIFTKMEQEFKTPPKNATPSVQGQTRFAPMLMQVLYDLTEGASLRLERASKITPKNEEYLGSTSAMSPTLIKYYADASKKAIDRIVVDRDFPDPIGVMMACIFLHDSLTRVERNVTNFIDNTTYAFHYSNNVNMFHMTCKHVLDAFVKQDNLIKASIFSARNEFVDKQWMDSKKKGYTIKDLLLESFYLSKISKQYESWLKKKKSDYVNKTKGKSNDFETYSRTPEGLENLSFKSFVYEPENPEVRSNLYPLIDGVRSVEDDDFIETDKNVSLLIHRKNKENFINELDKLIKAAKLSDRVKDFYRHTVTLVLDHKPYGVPIHAYQWDNIVNEQNLSVNNMTTRAGDQAVISIDPKNKVTSYKSCVGKCDIEEVSSEVKQCLNTDKTCETSFSGVYDLKSSEEVEYIARDMMINHTLYYKQGLMIMSFGGSGVGKTSLLFGIDGDSKRDGLIKYIHDGMYKSGEYPFSSEKQRYFQLTAYEVYYKDKDGKPGEVTNKEAWICTAGDKPVPFAATATDRISIKPLSGQDIPPVYQGDAAADDILASIKKIDTAFKKARIEGGRIKPTINNPESSRSVMIYKLNVIYTVDIANIKQEDPQIPIYIVDLPGYELINAQDTASINGMIQSAFDFMQERENDFLQKLMIPDDAKGLRTSAFVINNTLGANPAKLNAIQSSFIDENELKPLEFDTRFVPDGSDDDIQLQQRLAKYLYMYTAFNSKDKGQGLVKNADKMTTEPQNDGVMKQMQLAAEHFKNLAAEDLKRYALDRYNVLQRDQRIFFNLYSKSMTEIASRSLGGK